MKTSGCTRRCPRRFSWSERRPSRRRFVAFEVSRHGLPIWEYPLKNQVHPGIEIEQIEGVVAELELRETAVFVLLSWPAFLALSAEEQALAVAHRRMHNLIEAHVNDEVSRETDRLIQASHRGE